MQIVDLTPENEKLYFCCLEDWSDVIKEAGNHKECWYNKMKHNGLRVKLAVDNNGVIGGMIQYLPIEYSFVEGKDLYVILCIWVHGHKKGRGSFQKKGFGKALLKSAEEDVKQIGSKGIVAWGMFLPFFMRASWFKKHEYKVVDKQGFMRLLLKPFSENVENPRFIKQIKKPDLVDGKLNVSLFINGWCPAQNMSYERTKRAIKGLEDKIELKDINTADKNVMRQWGISDAIFINNKELRTGPPPSYQKIKRIIDKQLQKLK